MGTNMKTEDYLYVYVDLPRNDECGVSVMKRNGDKLYIVNMLLGKEAEDIYNKLIGEGHGERSNE